MSESGKTDRWNSLLETLGVPVSEPKPQPTTSETPPVENPLGAKPQPASMLPPPKAKGAPKPKTAPPAAKSPSYWSRIAGALGLEAPAAPEPPTVESLPVPQAQESRDRGSEELEKPRHRASEPTAREHEPRSRAFGRKSREERPQPDDRQRREERPAREERVRGGEERGRGGEPAPHTALNEIFGPKAPDMDVFGLAEEGEQHRLREPSASSGRAEDESGAVLDYDAPDPAGSDLTLGESVSREPHGRGDDSAEQEGGRRRRRRRGRGRGRRGSREAREGAAPQHEADIEPAGEDADFDVAHDEEMDIDVELDAEPNIDADQTSGGRWRDRQPEPQRRSESERHAKRGRDRHRPRRPSEREREEADIGGPMPYGEEGGQRPGFSPRDQRGGPADAIEADRDDEIEDVDEIDDGRGGDLPTHKKIPTWDEAVGFLIDANMANRGPDRDHGRGRGRGRR